MKKFDLEKALAGDPVVTRDGYDAFQVTKFDCDSEYPVRAVINGKIIALTIDGKSSIRVETCSDLFMKEPEMWVNVYWNENGVSIGDIYPSEEDAKYYGGDAKFYQTTIKLK